MEELAATQYTEAVVHVRIRHATVLRVGGRLGLAIRGGSDLATDIFISVVQPGTAASRAGLQVGDRVLAVNGISCVGVAHSRAVEILSLGPELHFRVYAAGQVPTERIAHETFTWENADDGQAIPGVSGASPPRDVARSNLRLLAGAEERKVTLNGADAALGFNIRGGSDFGLGIFVSAVDSGGQGEAVGLCRGDQIIMVNENDFENVSHAEAVSILQNTGLMMLTIRKCGRLPSAKYAHMDTKWLACADQPADHADRLDSLSLSRSFLSKGKFLTPHIPGVTSESLLKTRLHLLLSPSEETLVSSLLQSYRTGQLSVAALAMQLLHALNTPSKLGLLQEIRSILMVRRILPSAIGSCLTI